MKGRKITSREQILVTVLLIVFIGGAYAVFPLRAHLQAIDNARGSIEVSKAELEHILLPEGDVPDLDRLSKELESMREEQEGLEMQLAQLGGDLFAKWKPGSFEALNLEVSSLARLWDVEVLENAPLTDYEITDFIRRHNLAADIEVPLIPGDPELRPFRRLKLVAPFTAFRGFVEEFSRLNPRIVIAGFEINNDQFVEPRLQIELTWVLI